MIRYTLKCDRDHGFDSWFASSAAFEALSSSGHLACPECGSTSIDKALMAPQVRTARPETPTAPKPAPTSADTAKAERAALIRRMKAEVEANSDYVGLSFAAEARRMHAGELPARPIHGEARLDEARALIADGVAVAPLPFIPTRRTN